MSRPIELMRSYRSFHTTRGVSNTEMVDAVSFLARTRPDRSCIDCGARPLTPHKKWCTVEVLRDRLARLSGPAEDPDSEVHAVRRLAETAR